MNIRRHKTVCLVWSLVVLAACGSDSISTGPGTPAPLTAEEALQSLSHGLSFTSGFGLPFAVSGSVLGGAGNVKAIDVVIGGTTHKMYALGLRVTYPAGTCVQALFMLPPPVPPGPCMPPPLGLVLALWETKSVSGLPDLMTLIVADAGTSSFEMFPSEFDAFATIPAFAFSINKREEFWTAVGGSLTSQVTATNLACTAPPPPFAKTSTCRVASFEESGRITFERFDFTLAGSAGPPQRVEFVIPRQTVGGILQAITEIKPYTIPGPWDY